MRRNPLLSVITRKGGGGHDALDRSCTARPGLLLPASYAPSFVSTEFACALFPSRMHGWFFSRRGHGCDVSYLFRWVPPGLYLELPLLMTAFTQLLCGPEHAK